MAETLPDYAELTVLWSPRVGRTSKPVLERYVDDKSTREVKKRCDVQLPRLSYIVLISFVLRLYGSLPELYRRRKLKLPSAVYASRLYDRSWVLRTNSKRI